MKRTVILLLTLTTVLTLFAATLIPSCAEGGETAGAPGAIVDFGTIWGYEEFLNNVHRDTEHLFTGEYTVHGMDGKVKYTFNKDGYTTFCPKEPLDEDGKDADGKRQTGDWRMTCELEFDPSQYGFIAFYYRLTDRAHVATNQIYIRDDQHSGEFEATEGMWTPPALRANGEWQLKVLEIAKVFPAVSGTVKSLRIPIASRVGEMFDIQYAAAFATEEEAQNFDYEAYKASVLASHDDVDWEINEDGTIKWIEKEVPTEAPAEPTSGDSQATPDTGKKEDKGCGGLLGGGVAVLVALGVGAVACRKRKHGA